MNSAQKTLVLIPAAVIAAGVASWRAMSPAELHSIPAQLTGWVDLHTHPMVNLAFGGKLVYGGVDVGSLLPADQHCNHNVRATSWQQALSDDRSTARGYDMFENGCGDNIREQVLWGLQDANHVPKTPTNARGADDFKDWPKWDDITHQKMWVDWIRRAYQGGERVLVALAVNNKTLGDATAGPGDYATDDKSSADLQIRETKAFVGRHNDFMEVAYTPADLQRIVSQNKLAVVLGIEVDNIGDFNSGPAPSEGTVTAEISRLRGEGVRYIFPIHVLDNVFGGTAVYEEGFNLSDYREEGHFWDLTCSSPGEQITYIYTPAGFDLAIALVKATKLNIDIARNPPTPPNCASGTGHVNTRGLTPLGEFAINEMMKQGMIVDIDHMSRLSADRALSLAEAVPGGYPLVSGHTGIRGLGGAHAENSRTSQQLKRIAALHGMFGLGTAHQNAYTWLSEYNTAVGLMPTPGAVAFGTDLNGLVIAPAARPGSHVVYDGSFPKSALGSKQWDYNVEGVAHYGLLADFVRDMRTAPRGASLVDNYLNHGAEYFYQMWQRIENEKGRVGTPNIAMEQRTPVTVVRAPGDTVPSNAKAPAPVRGAVVVNAPPGETPHPGVAPGAAATTAPAAAPAAAPAPGAPKASPARVAVPVTAAAPVAAMPASPARPGPQLKLRVSQGLGTVKGTYWVLITAVDSATGVMHPGIVTINNVKGATGQKVTFKECMTNGVPTKCIGTVTVTNYPEVKFSAGS